MAEETGNLDLTPFKFSLPKKLESTEAGEKILAALNLRLETSGAKCPYLIPLFPASRSIINALYAARRSGRLIRGIEDAEKKLTAEGAGIAYSDRKTGTDRTQRISRAIIVTNDGSERFYRQTKKLVRQNSPRVLAIQLDITSFELGKMLFGPDQRVLFLLVSHKDAVINFLMSLTD